MGGGEGWGGEEDLGWEREGEEVKERVFGRKEREKRGEREGQGWSSEGKRRERREGKLGEGWREGKWWLLVRTVCLTHVSVHTRQTRTTLF